MKTKAVRIHGKMDLRLEEIELPQVGPDDVQVKVISDSICMSTYKAAVEGEEHKRVPNDVAEHPTIVGHEFCGVITEVGKNWKNKYKPGQGFAIQPAHFYKGSQLAPGYSYQYCGGDSQYSNIPIETLLTDNLLPYNSDTYFYGSLAEPMSCIIGTFHAMYHTKPGSYEHQMGIVEGGKMAMLASVGPMGLGAIDYALHCDRRPSLLVITDIDDARLERAQSIYTVEHAKEMGVELHYVNTAKPGCDTKYLRELSGGTGYDDVICFAPVKPVVEQAGDILGFDGCLNFFAGPTNSQFKAEFNWYNVRIHGIKKNMVKDAPTFDQVWERIHSSIENQLIVCHNAAFDTAVLCKLLEYYGIPVPNFDYVCTVKISQLLWPEMQNHKLDTVCSDLDIRLNHHEALSDARACGLIFAQALKSQHCFRTEDLMDALEMRIGHVSQAGRQSCSTSAEIRKKIQSEKKKQESRRRYYAKRRLTAEKGAKHS